MSDAVLSQFKKAEENNIKGKELTPFLLTLVKEMTGGMSLDANIELVYNNAKVAAKTAVCLANLGKDDEAEAGLDELRAEIADDTAESIKAELSAFRGEMETLIAQRVAAVQQMAPNPYMNPYMNPYAMPQQMQYQQNPQQMQYQQNPYGMPQQMQYQQNPYGMPQQPMAQPAPAPAPAPYVNPYKPVRPEPVPEPQPEPVPAPNPYKSIPDEEWVNPFAPKREKAPEPVAEEPVEEETIEEVIEEIVEEPVEEVIEEAVEEAVEEPAEEEVGEEVIEEESAPEVPAEEPAEEEEYTVTEYVPPVHEKKERKPDNQVKPETDAEGMTAYDPEFYRKRNEERKQRLAAAAGEAKHKEEEKAAEPEYIDCKGPLEFTGEHPWAWKCTRCGQLFQKHEIPHKCVKTD